MEENKNLPNIIMRTRKRRHRTPRKKRKRARGKTPTKKSKTKSKPKYKIKVERVYNKKTRRISHVRHIKRIPQRKLSKR